MALALSWVTSPAVVLLPSSCRAARVVIPYMCDAATPTPGGWKDTMQRLKADYEQGKQQAEAYMADRQRPKQAQATLKTHSLGIWVGALAVAAVQCEAFQFGLTFALSWLAGATPPGSSWPICGAMSGFLSGRVTAAISVALASRAAFRPVRLLAEVCIYKLSLHQLRGLETSASREELQDRLCKTAAILFALLMTVRALDLKILPGDTVGLLPLSARQPLLSIGTRVSEQLTAGTAAARASPQLLPLVCVMELDDQVAAAAAWLAEAAARVWSAISPGLLWLRVMLLK